MTQTVDYDHGWEALWDDMRRYGPTGRHSRRIVLEMIGALNWSAVLDVGCGPGSLLEALRERRPQASLNGADFSPAAIEAAKKRAPWADYHRLDLTQAPLDRRFDLILCTDVVEHIEEHEKAFASLAAMTAPGGHVLVSTLQGRMRSFEVSVGHVRNYRRGEVAALLQAQGLEIVRTVEWGFPFFSPLYRNFLEVVGSGGTEGRYGPVRRLIAETLYQLFRLNAHDNGDYVFVLARRPVDGA
jgi:2-polyprenyl-3-methyl-5-hydroxy-6-metoxy-1,4-benzoquinol methylase